MAVGLILAFGARASFAGEDPAPANPISFDPAAVQFTRGLENRERFRFTFAAKYRKGAKRLVYVAGNHTHGLDGPNLKTVKKMFDDLAPQAVLVEGFQTVNEYSYRSIDVDRFTRDRFADTGESGYAVYLAAKKALPVLGGEPPPKEFLEIQAEGFDWKDVLGYLSLRMIPLYKKAGDVADDPTLTADAFRSNVERELKADRRALDLDERFGYAEFAAWYRERHPGGPQLQKIVFNDLGAKSDPDATSIERLALALEKIRERRFILQLETLANRYDRILVVYGGSHLCRERKMLERVFGKPKDVKPY
ncbi:MAG: hypothetical protein HY078_00890 [Elusimicrobia bacterium]|nr:hypothetical protein [Elusimicrobiota bacterium]